MTRQNFSALKKVVANFPRARILVVGDLILDEYVWGSVSRISPEAPVPVVWVKRESVMPGGACNVATNIVSLGGKPFLAGVTGNDVKGAVLRRELDAEGVDISGIFADDARHTISKTRVVAQHQQVVRIDKESLEPVGGHLFRRMVRHVRERIAATDAVIIEDYGKGVITPRLLKEVLPFAKRHGKIVAVDPKEEHLSYYRGVTLMTPNIAEAQKASGMEIKDTRSLLAAGRRLLERFRCRIVLVTLGEHGMCVFRTGGAPTHIPTTAQEVFDVSGAGDTVIATYTLALISGADPIRAAHIANCAAGVVVGKVGTASVTPEELIAKMRAQTDRKGPRARTQRRAPIAQMEFR